MLWVSWAGCGPRIAPVEELVGDGVTLLPEEANLVTDDTLRLYEATREHFVARLSSRVPEFSVGTTTTERAQQLCGGARGGPVACFFPDSDLVVTSLAYDAHEATHASLDGVTGRPSRFLAEGFAEYYECAAERVSFPRLSREFPLEELVSRSSLFGSDDRSEWVPAYNTARRFVHEVVLELGESRALAMYEACAALGDVARCIGESTGRGLDEWDERIRDAPVWPWEAGICPQLAAFQVAREGVTLELDADAAQAPFGNFASFREPTAAFVLESDQAALAEVRIQGCDAALRVVYVSGSALAPPMSTGFNRGEGLADADGIDFVVAVAANDPALLQMSFVGACRFTVSVEYSPLRNDDPAVLPAGVDFAMLRPIADSCRPVVLETLGNDYSYPVVADLLDDDDIIGPLPSITCCNGDECNAVDGQAIQGCEVIQAQPAACDSSTRTCSGGCDLRGLQLVREVAPGP